MWIQNSVANPYFTQHIIWAVGFWGFHVRRVLPFLMCLSTILLVLYLPEVLLGVFLKDHLSDHAISLLKALQWPQGSPDKIVIPGNSLQATCSLTFGYFSLSTSGRAGPVPAFFTVVSLCPALCLEYHGHQINTH